jgi:hypothetical protein
VLVPPELAPLPLLEDPHADNPTTIAPASAQAANARLARMEIRLEAGCISCDS